MADITKCSAKNCKVRDYCYRYTAEDNPCWQSYANFNNDETIGDVKECQHFYRNYKFVERQSLIDLAKTIKEIGDEYRGEEQEHTR